MSKRTKKCPNYQTPRYFFLSPFSNDDVFEKRESIHNTHARTHTRGCTETRGARDMNTLSSTPLCASNRSWAKVSSSSQKLTSRYFQAKGRRKGATFQISESGCGRYSFETTICSATSRSTGDAGNLESQKFKEGLSFDKTLQSENWNFSEFTHENKLPPLLPWADAMPL